ncbi:MAG: hypothetical protein AB8D78_09915 [Akkermansiaceae bacterium]
MMYFPPDTATVPARSMRIPFYIAIPVSLFAAVLVWWLGTRDMDFLSPPSEEQLAKIEEQALASLPVSKDQRDAISIVVPIPDAGSTILDPVTPPAYVDVGDLTTPPRLDSYSERAPEGADKLILLAEALKNQGAFRRALLSYERVLDLAQANPEQIQKTLKAIRELSPTLALWNPDPELAHSAFVHIGTGEKFAGILPDVMEAICKDLRIASSGLVTFSPKLHIGQSIQATDAPTPVAVWITGGSEDTPSTDVLSFTTDDPDTLRNDLLKTIFNLTRNHVAKETSYNPVPEAVEEPITALKSNITRLLWEAFGASLNPETSD